MNGWEQFESPIEAACKWFVEDGKSFSNSVKTRKIELMSETENE